jgi:predicted RNA binding protein YcfA (HicA-like mRNA interferase family)
MSAKPALVSGRKLVKIFQRLGYEKVSQRGSHIKMKITRKRSLSLSPTIKKWTAGRSKLF